MLLRLLPAAESRGSPPARGKAPGSTVKTVERRDMTLAHCSRRSDPGCVNLNQARLQAGTYGFLYCRGSEGTVTGRCSGKADVIAVESCARAPLVQLKRLLLLAWCVLA